MAMDYPYIQVRAYGPDVAATVDLRANGDGVSIDEQALIDAVKTHLETITPIDSTNAVRYEVAQTEIPAT